MSENFQDRMFMGSESVYAAIERGEVQDVEAALMEVQAQASDED
ncbi:hypothetical protein ACWC24_36155 [Streptomyces sp. NPDC001443]